MLTTSIPIDKSKLTKAEFTVTTEYGYKDASLYRNSKGHGYIIFRFWSKDWQLLEEWTHQLCRQSMLSMAEWLEIE